MADTARTSSEDLRALLGGAEPESERTLRTSARILRQLVEHAPAAVALFDRDMRYIATSRRYAGDYGLGTSDPVGRSLYEVFPEITESGKEIHRRCLAGEHARSDDEAFPRRDGRTDWVRWELMPWYREDASIGGLILFSEVTTEQKQAVSALRASEERFRATFEQAAVGIAHVAPDGSWLRVNQKLCDIVGYTREELATKTFQDITHPADLDADLAFVRQVLAGERSTYSMEKRYIRKSGETVWINLTVSLVRKPGGEPDYFISVVEDIGERKRYEQLLEEAEALAHVGSAEADFGTGRVRLSVEMRRILGVALDEADRGIEELLTQVHPEDLGPLRELLATAAAGMAVPALEFRVQRPDGSVRRLHGRGVVRSGGGALPRLWGSMQDVSEQHQAEQERAKLQAQLARAQRMDAIGQLAGGVAHDFNNLVSVIMTYAGLALEELREHDPLRADIEEMYQAGARAAQLTKQLLAFSRQQVLEPKVLDLNRKVLGLEGMLRRLIGEDFELVLELGSDLGRVRADRGQVEQVIVNLVLNARDAMPSGGRITIATANVELDRERATKDAEVVPGPFVRLSVTDRGQGIDPAILPYLFEPFFTTKPAGKGTGLGLSTVYGIVRQSGGHVWVDSALGSGACFEICLPRISDGELADVSGRPPPGSATGSETILIVEDEGALRAVVCRVLRRAGYRVLEANGGQEALSASERHEGKIDLLLTDVVMPEMSGRELAEQLTKRRPGLEVLYMSGYTDDAMVRHGVAEHREALLAKPFDPGKLNQRVREVLDEAAARSSAVR